MAAMESAVNTIVKLWVNGAAVVADDAVLEVNPTTRAWRVRATLGRHSPFKQQFGLSMQLADGRTAHGRARMADAQDEVVFFEGSETLDGIV
jgi:hypothetical protein